MNENANFQHTGIAEECTIAGFWRRLIAFIIDIVILGITGFILGLFFFDFFVQLGGWGRALGFSIALLYFGVLNSSITGGQTIGKYITKIKVISQNGELLDLDKAFPRFVIIGIPFFLNGALINITTAWLAIILTVLVFGFGLSILYLFIFNRTTRQSLHDIIIGSYVVRKQMSTAKAARCIWKGHYVVVFLLLVASATLPNLIRPLSDAEFKEILSLQHAILNEPEIRHASVISGRTTTIMSQAGKTTITYVSAQVVLAKKLKNYDSLANRIAKLVIEKYPAASKKDVVALTISYGYDIGISYYWMHKQYSLPVEQWRTRFKAKTATL